MSYAPVDYLLIGHITADLLPDGERCPGGTVTYAARAAQAFGLRVGVLTSAAPGDPVLDALTPYAQVALIPTETTTTFENIYNQKGERTQYIHGVAAPITAADIPAEWAGTLLVHIAPIAGEATDPAIPQRFRADTRCMVTLQGWLRRWDEDGRVSFRRWFDPAMLRGIDILVFSEEDIREAPALEPELVQAGVPDLFVTQAARGGLHYHRGQSRRYTTPQHVEQHPTGAGDIFAACLLAGQHLLRDLDAATTLAATLAAESVTRPGLEGVPTAERIRELIDNQQKHR